MVLFKLFYHLKAIIMRLFFLLYFRRNLKIGKKTTWRDGFRIWNEDGKIRIGHECFFNHNCSISCIKGEIQIGNNCLFGEGVKIYNMNHRFRRTDIPIKDQGYSIGDITIGHNCWIGSNVVILKGSRIGDNCVIGAGVIVDGLVPEGYVLRRSCEGQSMIRKDSLQNDDVKGKHKA